VFLLTSFKTLQYSPFPTAYEAMILALGNREIGDEGEVIHRTSTLLLPLA